MADSGSTPTRPTEPRTFTIKVADADLNELEVIELSAYREALTRAEGAEERLRELNAKLGETPRGRPFPLDDLTDYERSLERERDEALQRVEGLARALERIAKWKPTMWDGESDLRADATEDFQDIARQALSDYGEEK